MAYNHGPTISHYFDEKQAAVAEESELKDDNLVAALARHGIELAPDRIEALDRYAKRLWDWNERLNLTRHMTYEKFVARDVVDSLQEL